MTAYYTPNTCFTSTNISFYKSKLSQPARARYTYICEPYACDSVQWMDGNIDWMEALMEEFALMFKEKDPQQTTDLL